jgi:hypothetical protein
MVGGMDHADFSDALRGGRFRREDETIAIEVKRLGNVIVRSGRITVCDPLAPSVILDLARPVPVGEHPVEVAIAKLGKDQRVALGCVRFAKRSAVKWEMATAKGQNAKKLAPGEFYGYGVDAGTGCFIDTKAFDSLEGEETGDAIFDGLEKTRVNTWAWANVKLGNANVVAFSSGYGDGFYASYWGFDAKGALVALVTDFGLLTEPIEEKLFFPTTGPFKHATMKSAGVSITKLAGKAFGFRMRGDASVALATSDGKPVPASAQHTYTDRDRTVVFKPKKKKDLQLAVTVTLGFKPLARVK